MRVCGVCFKHSHLKKYILWALKLMEDMPAIFPKVEYLNQFDTSGSCNRLEMLPPPFFNSCILNDDFSKNKKFRCVNQHKPKKK